MPQEHRLYLAPSRREGAGLLFICPVPKRKGERSSIRIVLPVCKTACRTGRNRIRRSLYRRHKNREHSESVYLSLLRKRELVGARPLHLAVQDRSVAQTPHWGFHCSASLRKRELKKYATFGMVQEKERETLTNFKA